MLDDIKQVRRHLLPQAMSNLAHDGRVATRLFDWLSCIVEQPASLDPFMLLRAIPSMDPRQRGAVLSPLSELLQGLLASLAQADALAQQPA